MDFKKSLQAKLDQIEAMDKLNVEKNRSLYEEQKAKTLEHAAKLEILHKERIKVIDDYLSRSS